MQISGCFKKVPLSVAKRHQYDLAYRLLCGHSSHCDVVLHRGTVTCLSELSMSEEINISMGNIGLYFELYRCNTIEINSVTYKCGCHIVLSQGEMPLFGKLIHILARDQGEKVWFVCEKL